MTFKTKRMEYAVLALATGRNFDIEISDFLRCEFTILDADGFEELTELYEAGAVLDIPTKILMQARNTVARLCIKTIQAADV